MIAARDQASELDRHAISTLVERGRALGFEAETEVPVPGGRIDVVWFLRDLPLPGAIGPLPAVAFEIESSWRTRKHIKGDYLNLFDLGASLGVIVLLGVGDDVESTRRFARNLVDRSGPKIAVWSEAELDELVMDFRPPGRANERGDDGGAPSREHARKYHRLWAWLTDQPGDHIETTFAEIEEVIGMRLPPSSRRHPAHWHSYDGSAVVRAVQDAGWRTRDLKLEKEQVTFVRVSDRRF